ncbi:translational activator of cytochrome c oxidase 1 [Drosophila kikkawai]|uniref:Translational activator of cytochrome c oxidase 1 n=1 Tax=Drosophila kikkawai TaxID=30033 RepID=A0A6P4JMV6_DROKI|nr:uncharacterized protein LOC108084352 [Drosophila kikkawai]
MSYKHDLETADKILPNKLTKLKASMNPSLPRPAIICSDSKKLENDKRNGLDLEMSDEPEAAIVKRVRWAPIIVSRSSSKSFNYITPSSTKQIPFDQDTPDEVRLAHRLRLAVHRGGGSIDPEKNFELRAQLSPLQLPYSQVQRILRECELYEREYDTYSLHIDYGRQLVAMVCKVRTNDLKAVKLRLANFLRQYKSRLFNRHLLTETGLIQANFPKSLWSPSDFQQTVCTDALWCKATDSRITDFEKKDVLFKCQPNDLREATAKLRHCGYKIVHTELGYCPNKPMVNLTDRQMKRYQEFLKRLKQDEDIVKVYDNVRVQ